MHKGVPAEIKASQFEREPHYAERSAFRAPLETDAPLLGGRGQLYFQGGHGKDARHRQEGYPGRGGTFVKKAGTGNRRATSKDYPADFQNDSRVVCDH